jgi:hypothetical protein
VTHAESSGHSYSAQISSTEIKWTETWQNDRGESWGEIYVVNRVAGTLTHTWPTYGTRSSGTTVYECTVTNNAKPKF